MLVGQLISALLVPALVRHLTPAIVQAQDDWRMVFWEPS